MNRKELAGELGISTAVLRRKMKKKLSPDFLSIIEGEFLLKEHVQHIHEKLSDKNRKW